MTAGIITPRVVAFDTRAALGLAAPRSVSHSIDTNPGGAAIHYGGDSATIRTHADCQRLWRQWQAMHMRAPRGWVDIAYNGGACQHGHALAGRGLGVRSAAQGTNDGNDRYHAFVWLNGGDEPTVEALAAISWWVQQARAAGGGLDVRGHRLFHSTGCPGDPLFAYARLLDGKPLTGGTPKVTPAAAVVQATQRAVHVTPDGVWGRKTDTAVTAVRTLRAGHPSPTQIRAAQVACGTTADGVWGPASKKAHTLTTKALQLGWRPLVPALAADGVWGAGTDAAWVKVRAQLNHS